MLKLDYKYQLVKELGDSCAILYEFFYEKRRYNHFSPTDDAAIGRTLGWTASKVTRIKSQLKKANYLHIVKGSTSTGVTLYQVLLGKDIIMHYLATGEVAGDLELSVIDKAQAKDA